MDERVGHGELLELGPIDAALAVDVGLHKELDESLRVEIVPKDVFPVRLHFVEGDFSAAVGVELVEEVGFERRLAGREVLGVGVHHLPHQRVPRDLPVHRPPARALRHARLEPRPRPLRRLLHVFLLHEHACGSVRREHSPRPQPRLFVVAPLHEFLRFARPEQVCQPAAPLPSLPPVDRHHSALSEGLHGLAVRCRGRSLVG
mmetsp:Transcript_23489/g.76436  ORF Transcript_23489/g.76436 Transcript_23489/m.76436 type:complete len:203 (+) Transcript_23489:84-692(+)